MEKLSEVLSWLVVALFRAQSGQIPLVRYRLEKTNAGQGTVILYGFSFQQQYVEVFVHIPLGVDSSCGRVLKGVLELWLLETLPMLIRSEWLNYLLHQPVHFRLTVDTASSAWVLYCMTDLSTEIYPPAISCSQPESVLN